MKPQDLKNLIQTGESHYLEFKKTTPHPGKIVREINAFTNSKGGTLLIGVGDDKSITGINEFYEEEYLLRKAAEELCVPSVKLKIELVHLPEKDVMVVTVPEAIKKPVYVKNKLKRLVYVRRHDESVLASDERIEILKHKSSDEGVTFEYGENEQRLFRYLNEYGEITVADYAHLINRTSYSASRILIKLVSAGVLNLFTRNEVDYYTFSGNIK
ncbi:MAG: helix-turn-helix domain-containing protein [Balneolaceae bacterium]